ncbi:hypothetical protein LCGC14_1155850 [marine sediment metagenome]|uniref:LamG-like jellyroll fold domain-containing protein n=1 Tax=marine sediment metagenome TaxID=412755 RepID=A0A0F9LU08_9ZZZZ
MATTDIYHIVGSLRPSRHAAKFIATADQAVLIDAFAVTRVAANDTVGTFSAWVNIPDNTGDYAIISIGDTAAIEFLTLRVTAGKLVIECNVATADKYEHTSTNVVIEPHRWYHVAVTHADDAEPDRLFVDGKRVAQTVTLGTDNSVWINDMDLTDDGSIGAGEEAGAAAQIREFKGAISDVKYWNVTLTDAQVLQDFDGVPPDTITGTSGDLKNHWDFDDDYVDNVAGENGTAGASILLVNQYSEFTSRLSFMTGTPVDEDNVQIAIKDQEGHATVIKAA